MVTGSVQLLRVVAEQVARLTVTDAVGDVPPGPVHWSVYVLLAVTGAEGVLPESEPG